MAAKPNMQMPYTQLTGQSITVILRLLMRSIISPV